MNLENNMILSDKRSGEAGTYYVWPEAPIKSRAVEYFEKRDLHMRIARDLRRERPAMAHTSVQCARFFNLKGIAERKEEAC